VGYPPAEAEDCTIWFAIAGAGADEWEGILGRRVDEHSAEIVGIPVFVDDANLADHVATETTPEGADVASEVLLDRGNFTFRAFFEPGSEPGEHWRPLMSELEPFGCWFDTWNERLVAISTAPEHAQAVADYLATRERRGELQYEAARRHP